MKRTAFLSFLALTVLCLCSGTWAQAAQRRAAGDMLFTHSSIERAWESAVTAKKPLLVMFTSEQCHYCEKMLAETYSHPAIRRMLAGDTETVLAHADDYRPLVKKLGIRGYPTTLLISPQGQVLDMVEGFVDAQKFAKRVSPILAKQATRVGDASAIISDKDSIER